MRVWLNTVVSVWAGFESDLRTSWIIKKVNRMKSIWELSQTEIDVNTSEKVAVIKLWPPRIPSSYQQLMFFHVVMKIVFTYKQNVIYSWYISKWREKNEGQEGTYSLASSSSPGWGVAEFFCVWKWSLSQEKAWYIPKWREKKWGTRGRLTSWNWLSILWGVALFF